MIADTITNAEGRFVFNNLILMDSTSLILKAKNLKGKDVDISIDHDNSQVIVRKINSVDAGVIGNQGLIPYLNARAEQFREMRANGVLNRGILSEVKIVRAKPKVKYSSNLNGPGNADVVLSADDLRDCIDLTDCLKGRVTGLVIENGIPYLSRSIGMSLSRVPSMLIILDGTSLAGFNLRDLSSYNVESIEILKTAGNTAIYGLQGSAGVMIITTKRGQSRFNVTEQGLETLTPLGFYVSRQFYSPIYDVQENKTTPDLRSTIYWAPDVVTGPNGKASIEFYTADKPGTYKAVIEGIDLSGSVIRKVQRFKVN
jgi:TonB-dependent SusC/RagA subfamily outer membrane receptor